MDAPDTLLEHRRVPGKLQVDAGARGALKVQADAASIREEHDARLRAVMELDDALGPLPWRLGTRADHVAVAGIAEHSPQAPGGEPQHAAPLAEHDDLAALIDDEIADQATELAELRREESVEQRWLGSRALKRGPELVEAHLP